jgi:lipopolysaccharide export system ATP-binding protein
VGVLEVDNVRKVYGGRVVVKGVSLRVQRGRITGLLGANGAGKTTTFYMVVGVVRPDGGRVVLDGEDVTHLPMHKRARLGIGYLAQEASMVLEFMGLSRRERDERATELLEELSLMHVKDSLGRALSGGERRRAEIARTLASRPAFILLDEPFAGVDPIAVGEIQKIVEYLSQKDLGILITDHNVRETLSICDHTYVMAEGRVIVEGTAEDIINNAEARAAYLGDDFEMTDKRRRHGVPVDPEPLAGGPWGPPEVVGAPEQGAPFPDPRDAPTQKLEAPIPVPDPVPEKVATTRPAEPAPPEPPRRAAEPAPPSRGGGLGTVWPPPPGEPMVRGSYQFGGLTSEDGEPPGGERIFQDPKPERRRAVGGDPGAIPWPGAPGSREDGDP